MRRYTIPAWGTLIVAVMYLAWPVGSLSQTPTPPPFNAPARSLKMTCTYCHQLHGGTLKPTGTAAIEALCMSCHNGTFTDPQTGKTAVLVATHENSRTSYGNWRVSCLGCHSPHRYAKAEGTDALNPPTGYGNWLLVGDWVREAGSATDGLARIRRPVIVDTNGDNGGTGKNRYTDDVMTGYYCASGIANDPACSQPDPPSPSDHVRKVVFWDNRYPGTPANNQWAQPLTTAPSTPGAKWYNGACNVCHTRTTHHRRDNSGGDHDHNVTKACHDCHLHNKGWIK